MSGRTFVVIGSNSFTGSHIVDALLEEPADRVAGVSRSPESKDLYLPYKRHPGANFRFHRLDLRRQFAEVAALLDRLEPQVVINVAALSEVALSYERPAEYFDTNPLAVVRLCEHLRRRPYLERYVHISSAEVFGSCGRPLSEESP
ncbi:MAG: NAD-dependent epimerase/dehydratase family protein, partial [Nitrospinota bacterium]